LSKDQDKDTDLGVKDQDQDQGVNDQDKDLATAQRNSNSFVKHIKHTKQSHFVTSECPLLETTFYIKLSPLHFRKTIISNRESLMRPRCGRIIQPLCENALSTGAEVAGVQNVFDSNG